MEFLRDMSKDRRELIKDVELNGDAAFIAKDFFPNSPEAQALLVLEMKGGNHRRTKITIR
jgi:hypothetical protein